jgi:hypothetical protein
VPIARSPFVAALAAVLLVAVPRAAVPAAGGAQNPPADAHVRVTGGELGTEHFVLARQGGGEPLALVSWRRHDVPGGRQLEREIVFAGAPGHPVERVLHVERLTESDARLVWREIGTASGRSLSAQWTGDARGLRTFEWGRDGARRGTLEAWNGVVMPLYLIELARTGRATNGGYAVFDPLARRIETVTLHTSYELAVGARAAYAWRSEEPAVPREAAGGEAADARQAAGTPRTVELHRRDGTLAGRFVFVGTELVAFQLQEGGPEARRVPAEAFERLLGELQADARRPPASAGR